MNWVNKNRNYQYLHRKSVPAIVHLINYFKIIKKKNQQDRELDFRAGNEPNLYGLGKSPSIK